MNESHSNRAFLRGFAQIRFTTTAAREIIQINYRNIFKKANLKEKTSSFVFFHTLRVAKLNSSLAKTNPIRD